MNQLVGSLSRVRVNRQEVLLVLVNSEILFFNLVSIVIVYVSYMILLLNCSQQGANRPTY